MSSAQCLLTQACVTLLCSMSATASIDVDQGTWQQAFQDTGGAALVPPQQAFTLTSGAHQQQQYEIGMHT